MAIQGKLKLLIILVMLLPAWAWGAAYYVDSVNGSDSNNGLTINTPKQDSSLSWVNNSARQQPDDVINFARGSTWNATLAVQASGTSGHPVTFQAYGTGNAPQFNGGSYSVTTGTKNYIVFNRLRFSAKRAYLSGSNGVTHSIKFQYCVFDRSGFGSVLMGLHIVNSNIDLLNCRVSGNEGNGVQVDAGSSYIYIRNSQVIGNGFNSTSYFGIYSGAGNTIDYDYTLIAGNGANPYSSNLNLSIASATVIDGGHNLINQYPLTKSLVSKESYVVMTVDDKDAAYVKSLQAVAPNIPITFFVNTGTLTDPVQYLIDIKNAGGEIASHTWSHSNMSLTTGFAITTTNTNPTCNVDVTNSQIILATTTGGNSVTFSWVGNKTITDLKTAVAGKGWTISTTTNINDAMHLAALKDSSGAQVVPYSPLLDKSAPNYAFFREEIDTVATWMTANLGYAPTSFSWPNGNTDTSAQTYLINNGNYLGARTVGGTVTWAEPDSYNLYNIQTKFSGDYKGDGSEATIRAAARSYLVCAQVMGGVLTFLNHSSAELTAQQFGWLTDELRKGGANFATMGQALAAIRASHSTADNITYTKTFSTDISDYRLKPSSPCKNAGVSVGLTTDFLDKPIRGLPDIGAYEIQPTGNKSSFGFRNFRLH